MIRERAESLPPPRRSLPSHRASGTWLAAAAFFAAAAGSIMAQEKAPRSEPRVILRDAARAEALLLMSVSDHGGLGEEARRIAAWMREGQPPFTLDRRGAEVEDSRGVSLALSAAMTLTLKRVNEWYGLEAPEDDPITHEQLKAAALAPASVARIQQLFEAAIRRGVRIEGQWLTPEVGGEATIDSELRFAEAPDPRWSLVQDLVRAVGDPTAVASWYERRAIEVGLIDGHGLLKGAILRLKLGMRGSADEVRRAVVTVARNAAPTYSLGIEEHFALVAGRDWRGRYVGGWHTHSPHEVNQTWAGGDVPSFEDMRNALDLGQYLTLSFQPDGFDLYDAAPLADAKRIDLSLLKVIRYRSVSWRDHFRGLRPGPQVGSLERGSARPLRFQPNKDEVRVLDPDSSLCGHLHADLVLTRPQGPGGHVPLALLNLS